MGRTIAIVANSPGNLLTFRRGLVRAFTERGDRVVLVAPDGPRVGELPLEGTTYVTLRHLRRSGLNPLRDLALVRELTGIYRREAVTHALHFTIKPVVYGSLAARRSGAVNVSTLTGLGYAFIRGGWQAALARTLYRTALPSAHRVVFHNDDDRRLFLQRRLCRADHAVTVGGSGLRMADFPYVDYAEADPHRVLFAGRLLVDKGVREFAEAARLVRKQRPELNFHLVGPFDPDYPAAISTAELDRWQLAGDLSYGGVARDIRPHLRSAALVVLPSYREGCPRVLLEAAATGRALVGTDVPGVRRVINDRNGWLVPVRRADLLAETILEAMGNQRRTLPARGEQGRARVEGEFSEAVVNAAYLEWTE